MATSPVEFKVGDTVALNRGDGSTDEYTVESIEPGILHVKCTRFPYFTYELSTLFHDVKLVRRVGDPTVKVGGDWDMPGDQIKVGDLVVFDQEDGSKEAGEVSYVGIDILRGELTAEVRVPNGMEVVSAAKLTLTSGYFRDTGGNLMTWFPWNPPKQPEPDTAAALATGGPDDAYRIEVSDGHDSRLQPGAFTYRIDASEDDRVRPEHKVADRYRRRTPAEVSREASKVVEPYLNRALHEAEKVLLRGQLALIDGVDTGDPCCFDSSGTVTVNLDPMRVEYPPGVDPVKVAQQVTTFDIRGGFTAEAMPQPFAMSALISREGEPGDPNNYYRARWKEFLEVTTDPRRAMVEQVLPLEAVAERPEHAAHKLLVASGIQKCVVLDTACKRHEWTGGRIEKLWLETEPGNRFSIDVEVEP